MKKYIRILTLAVLLAAVLCTLTACGGKAKSEVGKFIGVEFSGLDGQGTARVDFDYGSFEYEIMSQWKEKEKSLEKLGTLTRLESSFEFELDKTEGLKNGDKVKVTMTYDEERAKQAGCKLSDTSATFTVEGLKEPIPVDPFDPSVFNNENGISFRIEGISPKAELRIERNFSDTADQRYVSYTVDKDENIANGDVITVTAELIGWGVPEEVYLTQTETTITVEGLNSYISDLSMVTPEILAQLQEVARMEFEKSARGMWIDLYLSSTTDGSNLTYRLSGKDGHYSDLRFTDNGFIMNGYDAYCLILPFHMDITQLGSRYWDGLETEEETFRDFYNCASYIKLADLVVDPQGNLVQDANRNNTVDLYEAYKGFHKMGASNQMIFEDENKMYEEMKLEYFENNLVEGTFNK